MINWGQKELLILAFDHRSLLTEELFGGKNHEPTAKEREETEETKRLIFSVFHLSPGKAASLEIVGLLVDEEFGANILQEAKKKGFTFTMPPEKLRQSIELSCCKKTQTGNGTISVCVVSEQDMGKKVIAVFDWNGKGKWFNKIPAFTRHLDKLHVSPDDKTSLILFVNTHFRTLRKYDEQSTIGVKGFGVGTSKRKEV